MEDPKKLLQEMGISLETIDEDYERAKQKDRRICVCGHAIVRHHTSGGFTVCKPGKGYCHCECEFPVLEVSDTRIYVMKTRGPVQLHAVPLGMRRASVKGHTARWLDGLQCESCDKSRDIRPLHPTLFVQEWGSASVVVASESWLRRQRPDDESPPPKRDVLLCAECLARAPQAL